VLAVCRSIVCFYAVYIQFLHLLPTGIIINDIIRSRYVPVCLWPCLRTRPVAFVCDLNRRRQLRSRARQRKRTSLRHDGPHRFIDVAPSLDRPRPTRTTITCCRSRPDVRHCDVIDRHSARCQSRRSRTSMPSPFGADFNPFCPEFQNKDSD